MPTSMDEARPAEGWKEWLFFVENKKKLTEESKEEEKEKPKFADECVEYPRDPPRDDAKCCESKLHETLQKVKIDRKCQAANKEAIVTLSKEEQLAQQKAQIAEKAQATMDKAINQAMIHYYGPLTQQKRDQIKQMSSAYSSRRNGPFSQSLGASLKNSGLIAVRGREHAASLAKVNKQQSEQSVDGRQAHARRDALVPASGAHDAALAADGTSPLAQQGTRKSRDREFLDKMHQRRRFVNDLEDHLFYA